MKPFKYDETRILALAKQDTKPYVRSRPLSLRDIQEVTYLADVEDEYEPIECNIVTRQTARTEDEVNTFLKGQLAALGIAA